MRAIDYAFRQGAASLWRSGSSGAFAVAAIALAMLVLGALLLLTWNAEQVLARWTSAAELSVYLVDGATSEQRGAIETTIDRSAASGGREFVSKADALVRFRSEFAELAALAEDVDNPFPASIEVRMAPGAGEDGSADALVRDVASLAGVVDVRYDREWIARIGSALGTFRTAGLAFAALMAIVAAVTVAAVVRLGLDARRDEIEIMELVGAPLSYIRGPFVAEGLLQGGAGAVLALAALGVAHAVARGLWGPDLAALLGGESLRFLPVGLWVYLVLGGMGVGSVGGLLASLRAG
jgi:cell division transport system permease protein